MTLNRNLLTSITKGLLRKLEEPYEKLEDLKIHENFRLLLPRNTYEALEYAHLVYEKGLITREEVVGFARIHYIKMKNSSLKKPQTINEFLSRYPELKGRV